VPREAIATPERILSAAFVRFSRYGFRRTSMEDIAQEAGVSRAALYLQFRNKEEIFVRLAQKLQDAALAGATAALAAGGPLADRVRAAIEAKSLHFVEITLAQPHGAELLDETGRLCGELIADMDRRFLEQMTRLFRRSAQSGEIDLAGVGLGAGEAAALLLRSVKGMRGAATSVEDYLRGLDALVRVFIAGLGARPAERAPRVRPGVKPRPVVRRRA